MENDIIKFQKKIKINFKSIRLLEQVFIHRSYINEHRNCQLEHNERLEFLGDAVLELIVTEYLYLNYPNPEGELTNWRSALVKGESLSEHASALNMDGYLKLSKGEQSSTGKARHLILANSFEALIGAIYLDQGYETTKKFLKKNLIFKLSAILKKESYIDSKSKFQELAQEKYSITPSYKVLAESGPDHDKKFVMGVYLNEREISQGQGSSKQEAEQSAAKNALKQKLD